MQVHGWTVALLVHRRAGIPQPGRTHPVLSVSFRQVLVSLSVTRTARRPSGLAGYVQRWHRPQTDQTERFDHFPRRHAHIPYLNAVTEEDQSELELEGGRTRSRSKGRGQIELAWKDVQSMRARLNTVLRTKTGVAALTQASHPEILRQVRASRRRATVDCVLDCGQSQGGRREV